MRQRNITIFSGEKSRQTLLEDLGYHGGFRRALLCGAKPIFVVCNSISVEYMRLSEHGVYSQMAI